MALLPYKMNQCRRPDGSGIVSLVVMILSIFSWNVPQWRAMYPRTMLYQPIASWSTLINSVALVNNRVLGWCAFVYLLPSRGIAILCRCLLETIVSTLLVVYRGIDAQWSLVHHIDGICSLVKIGDVVASLRLVASPSLISWKNHEIGCKFCPCFYEWLPVNAV